ncbi:MAG: hypothetical protein WCX82_04440 [archaeon]|jgi:hypothetical protein
MNSIILGFFEDMGFILKLAFIIFVVVFVKQRITKNWLAITAIVIACVVLIFFYWPIFGSMYVLYVLISIGIGGVLVDTFFVTMGEGQQQGGSPEQMIEQGRPQHRQAPGIEDIREMHDDMDMINQAGRRRQ